MTVRDIVCKPEVPARPSFPMPYRPDIHIGT